jgi:hypothetical protein
MRPRRNPTLRPAGLSFTVDDPSGRSHYPRAFAHSYQQCYELIYDGPTQFAFAGPLRLPTRAAESLLLSRSRLSWASHLAAGHVSDTLVKRGSDTFERRARQ